MASHPAGVPRTPRRRVPVSQVVLHAVDEWGPRVAVSPCPPTGGRRLPYAQRRLRTRAPLVRRPRACEH